MCHCCLQTQNYVYKFAKEVLYICVIRNTVVKYFILVILTMHETLLYVLPPIDDELFLDQVIITLSGVVLVSGFHD